MSKIPYGKEPFTEFLDELDAIKVSLICYPDAEQSRKMIINVASGYVNPNIYDDLSEADRDSAMKEIISGGSLPKCLELLGNYVVLIENVPLTCTHMWVRERFFTILQESTATSCQRDKSFVMPRSFAKDLKFYDAVKKWYLNGKELYCRAVDEQGVSVQNARLFIPKNNCNHIFVGFDALAFKNAYFRRSCTQEEPAASTYVFEKIKDLILEKFPYLDGLFISSCSVGACLHSKVGKHANVVFKRDELHKKFLPAGYDLSKEETLHRETRDQMNIGPKIRDERYLSGVKVDNKGTKSDIYKPKAPHGDKGVR